MSITGVHSAIQLPHDAVQCLDQTVEYQCTVSGSGLRALRWSLIRDDGKQLLTVTGSATIGGLFRVQQLSQSPLVSNISFTAVSSINGYTFVCEDTTTTNNETILINIAGKNYSSKLVHYGN